MQMMYEIIFENTRGITSHELLAEMIKKGYEYKSNYLSILSQACREYPIRYGNSDKYYAYKEVVIPVKLPFFYIRHNCYDCPFQKDLAKDHTFIRRDNLGVLDQEAYCALNPLLRLVMGMGNIPDECPINVAIRTIKAGEEQ